MKFPIPTIRGVTLAPRPQPRTSPNALTRWLGVVALMFVMAALTGCSTTRFFERQKVADRAMQFDPDSAMTYMLNKLAGAREGGFGGYGGAAAGGCGCE